MEDKIKICHLIGSLQYGGAENQVVRILNRLNSNIFKKYLITFKQTSGGFYPFLDKNIKTINIKMKRLRYGGMFQCIYKLYVTFKKFRVDIVHTHMYHASLYGSIAAKLAGVPYVLTTEHGKNLWKKTWHRIIERYIISNFSNLRIAVSQDIYRLRELYGEIPKRKLIYIPNCVEVPKFSKQITKKQIVTIGTVGRLVPAKDYPTLLEAFKIVSSQNPNAKLFFVGNGEELSMLQLKTKKLNLEDKVNFVGFQQNVLDWLLKMDIFVMSSIREGIPVSMLEAMSVGLPVISTAVGGIPDVISNNIDGLLVEKRNPRQLAEALERLIIDINLREKLGKNAREKIKSQYSCDKIARDYERVYMDLIKN